MEEKQQQTKKQLVSTNSTASTSSSCESVTELHTCCDHVGKQCFGTEQTLDEMDFERGIWSAAKDADIDRLRYLLANGAHVDQLDAGGLTALHHAAREGHVDIAFELIQHGATIDIRTRAGQATPLHRASMAGHIGFVDVMLKGRADISAVDGDGKNALHRACHGQHYDICKLLLDYNKDILYVTDNRGNYPIDYVQPDNERLLQLIKQFMKK